MVELTPGMLGWLRDHPDHRDYTLNHEAVQALLISLSAPDRPSNAEPTRVDLREDFPAVVDQGGIRSGPAHACIAVIEYLDRRAKREVIPLSRIFLYKTTRRLMHLSCDTGTTLRATLKAIVRFGIPPEEYLPYDVTRYNDEPDPFLYSCARKFPSLTYVRLDLPGSNGEQVLRTVKNFLEAGFPSVFGLPMTVEPVKDGEMVFPRPWDSFCGGQACVAVGFDNKRRVGRSRKGALLVRNSWGQRWGEGGYGWLSYEYVKQHLAVDFWALLSGEWLVPAEFSRPVG